MLTEGARFRVDGSAEGNCLLLTGEFDMLSSAELASAVERVLATHGQVELDFSGVTFMDSSGLQVLCLAHANGPVRLRGVPDHIRALFALTGLDVVLHIDSEPTG